MEIKIYTLSSTRKPDDIRYVGKTKQTLKRRLQGHLSDAKKYHNNGITTNKNYNWIYYEIESGYDIIITELDSEEFSENEDWKWLEQYWISQCKAWGFDLNNLTSGGDGNQKFSEESIRKRAEKITGIPRDKHTKKKISESLTGIKRSEETKSKIKIAITELQGEKIKQFDTDGNFIKEWNSISEASQELGIDRANIGHCCAHKPNHNSAGNYIWRYSNDNSPVVSYTPNSICQFDLDGNLIAIYKTAIKCQEATGISTCSISKCVNGKINEVKGFLFKKYKDL